MLTHDSMKERKTLIMMIRTLRIRIPYIYNNDTKSKQASVWIEFYVDPRAARIWFNVQEGHASFDTEVRTYVHTYTITLHGKSR